MLEESLKRPVAFRYWHEYQCEENRGSAATDGEEGSVETDESPVFSARLVSEEEKREN